MMTRFFGDEMTLKTTLLMWEPMVTSNGLVSWVTNLDERLWLSMTLIDIGVLFSIRTNLYCWTNSLFINHANALESKNVWASIIISLLHLAMIGTNKHGVEFKNRLGPFSLHDASRSNLVVLTKIRSIFVFQLLWLWIGNRNGVCNMWSMLLWTLTSNMTWFSTLQTKIIFTSMLFFLFCEGFKYCLINLHGVVIW